MKNFIQILSVILFFSLGLTSCSTDSNGDLRLLQSVVEVTDNGSTTVLFEYNGNKISSIDSETVHYDFTYTGDLITSLVHFDKNTNHQENLTYLYEDDKLIEVQSSENYIIRYLHQSNETVLCEKFIVEEGNELKIYHGTLTFENKNLVEEELVYNNDGIKSTTVNFSYGYDTRMNPFYKILGFNKLLNFGMIISKNNNINYTEIVEVVEGENITSSLQQKHKKFEYNEANCPVSVDSQYMIFGNENSQFQKTLFFY